MNDKYAVKDLIIGELEDILELLQDGEPEDLDRAQERLDTLIDTVRAAEDFVIGEVNK